MNALRLNTVARSKQLKPGYRDRVSIGSEKVPWSFDFPDYDPPDFDFPDPDDPDDTRAYCEDSDPTKSVAMSKTLTKWQTETQRRNNGEERKTVNWPNMLRDGEQPYFVEEAEHLPPTVAQQPTSLPSASYVYESILSPRTPRTKLVTSVPCRPKNPIGRVAPPPPP